MDIRSWLWAFGLLVLSGCSLNQPLTPEHDFEVPAVYRQSMEAVQPVIEQAWWHVLGDAQLDSLMTRLFAENLELESALARLQQARASLGATRAGQRPTLTAGGQTSRDRSAAGLVTETAQGSLSVAYELDLWGKYASRTRAARFVEEASAAEVRALYLGLSAQLADLYFWAAEQQAQLVLNQRNVAAFADTLQRVERRYRAGLAATLEVYQARQNLLAAQSRRPTIVATLQTAEHAIDVLLGDYPGAGLADAEKILPLEPAVFPAGLPAHLLGRRPDVQAAFARLQASDAQRAAALADRLPAVNLLGSLGRTSTELLTGPLTGDFWSLLAGLTLPVVDGGRRRAEVERQEAVQREALAAYRQVVLNAFREVEDALVANRTTEQRIQILVEQVAAAESSLRLALDNYLNGLSDYLPVLVAQTAQLEAQSGLLASRRQLVSDRITLAKALGGHWMENVLTRRMSAEQDGYHE